MEIILNEKLYAEKLIEDKTFKEKDLSYVLNILIRYLYSSGMERSDIYKYIEDYMREAYPSFNMELWYKYIDRYINKAKKRDLFEIEYVPVTQNELNKIKEVKNSQKERVLFTLLVLAKANNLKSKCNNNWVNYDFKTIFELARVSCSLNKRCLMIYELKEAGYVRNSKNPLSANIQVCFVDDSEPVLKITDMRELGYQYQELEKKTLIRRCAKCDRPYKLKNQKDRTRLCTDCRPPEPIDGLKIKTCAVCGKEFLCSPKNNRSTLCPEHQEEADREKKRIFIREKRNISKM